MMRRRRGAAAVEFVLSLGILTSVIFGFFELVYLQEVGVVTSAIAQDAANSAASVHTGDLPPTGTEVTSAVNVVVALQVAATQLPGGAGMVTTVDLTSVGGWRAVRVTLEVPYASITNVSFAPGSLTRTATAIIQQ